MYKINNTLIKIADQYEKTAKMLLEKAKMLRKGINPNKCIHGTNSGRFWGNKKCEPCGSPKTIICALKVDGRTSHKSTECNPANCNHFKAADTDKNNYTAGENENN